MQISSWLGLDERYDKTAEQTRARTPERLVLLAVAAALSSPLVGLPVALVWAAAALSAEAAIFLGARRRVLARAPRRARALRIAASAATSSCWAWLAVLLWQVGETPARLAAHALLVVVMLYCVRTCHRTPGHLAACLAAPLAATLLLPLTYRGQGGDFAISATCALVLAAYVLSASVDAYRSHRRLEAAMRQLVDQRQAADAANAAKSDFLAMISHEIRTPLNGVLGIVQAMADDGLPALQQERLAVLQDSGKAVLALLNDLLDLSKIEAGMLELEAGVIDVPALARALQVTFEPACATGGTELEVSVHPSAAGTWRGDPARLRQIANNLMSNAVKFTSAGRVSCAFRYEAPFLTLEVADTGQGMSEEALSRLFQKYAQAEASTARQFGGTGLGLSIVRQIAELMQGTVEVRSAPGEGSTFTVRLPLARCDEAGPAAEAAAPALAPGLRVLVADDHPTNRLVLQTLLEQAGIEAVLVENGAMAEALWRAGNFDALLLDIEMPPSGGVEVCRRIRAEEAASGRRRTPIIALTANAMTHHQALYAEAGMDALAPKPIELRQLLGAIQAAVSAIPDAPAGVQPAAASPSA